MQQEQQEDAKPVSYGVFVLAMSILLIIIGYLFTEVSRVQQDQATAVTANTAVVVQLSQLQTDVSWIKDRLSLPTTITTK